jgi:hypothetical protein
MAEILKEDVVAQWLNTSRRKQQPEFELGIFSVM